MDEQNTKRTRRTPQQMAEAVDSKIEKLNQELESLAAKRDAANEDFDKKPANKKSSPKMDLTADYLQAEKGR